MAQTILILDNDISACAFYREHLQGEYSLLFAKDLKSVAEHSGWALLLADTHFPDGTLQDQLPKLRALGRPILVASKSDDLELMRKAFAMGVSDYLVRPFSKNELLAKIGKALAAVSILEAANLTLKLPGQDKVSLTQIEYKILHFMERAGWAPLSRKEIQDFLWGSTKMSKKSLDVHLYKLRRKLEPMGAQISFTGNGRYEFHFPKSG